MTQPDTWLEDADILRIWAVVQGDLPEHFATTNEIAELENVINQTVMIAAIGEENLGAMIH
jgi:hypothetical protein